MKIEGRVLVLMTAVAGLSLSGCVSSPTYGTDKSAGAQLLDDVSNMATFGQGKKKAAIDYKPRPELVRPSPDQRGQVATLPPPQEKVAPSENGNWPESPEERRKRLRDEITANRDKNGYVSPVEQDEVPGQKYGVLPGGNSRMADHESHLPKTDPERIAALKKAREEQLRGSSTTRRYLSEPPLAYRQPAATAPVGELGEDEAVKERARKKAAGKKGSWRDYLPWN